MTRRLRRACFAGAALVALALLGASGTGLLCLLPAAVGIIVLAAGWFPGERALDAVRRRRAPAARRRSPLKPARRRHRPAVGGPRGGALIGSRLAGRAPPSLVL